jgi:hypothetical protein
MSDSESKKMLMYVLVILITYLLIHMWNTASRNRPAPKGSFYMLVSLTCFCFGLFFEYYHNMFLFTFYFFENLITKPKNDFDEIKRIVYEHLMKNQPIYLHVRLYFFIIGSIYLKSLLEIWDIHKTFETRPPKKS